MTLRAIDRLVLGIERHDPEFFLLRFARQPSELMLTEPDGRGWTCDAGRRFVLALQLGNPQSDLHSGHQSLHSIRRHPATENGVAAHHLGSPERRTDDYVRLVRPTCSPL